MADKMRIVIVGGVAGGASAAARARRLNENAEIILIERGENISFANCGLPYHIGGVIADRKRLLVQTPESMYATFRIVVRVRTEAKSINRDLKEIKVINLDSGKEETIRYDKLILSPGAEPIKPPIPGSDNSGVHTLRSLADMDAIINLLDTKKPAHSVVVGGGYIGLEMAEALRERGMGVTLVELANQVMAPVDSEMASSLHQHLRLHGVDLRLENSVTGITSQDGLLKVQLSNGEIVECGLIILAIGVRPETRLARDAGLTIGERGGIAVDDHMCTNDADIYAVGDAVEVTDFVGGFQTLIPLAGPANRQGRLAAENALGGDKAYRNTQGTGICKVFDLSVGMTGMNEKSLKRQNISYEKIYIHPANHAGYYPGAVPISLKLLFDPKTGKILGGQAVGASGVDKRIDVLAVAIRAGLSVFDLEELELSYAPPYGSAKDPINYAGFVASNIIKGDVRICHTEEMLNATDNQLILDVRMPFETLAGMVPGALNIPIQELRDRLDEVPIHKEILVYCQVGMRGYLACRLLMQKGYRCRNLTGGYKTFTMVTGGDEKKTGSPNLEVTDDSGIKAPQPEPDKPVNVVKIVDACGLQCPGPIMRVSNELKSVQEGEAIEVISSDPSFPSDIGPWCASTGNTLVKVVAENGQYKAIIKKGHVSACQVASQDGISAKKKSIVVFSGDFDKAVAAFVIANGAAAMGSEVTMFFTFWGLNVLRKAEGAAVKKNIIEKMFGFMMPRGAEKLKLSNMNMGGMGLSMIKGIMKNKNVPMLSEFIGSAKHAGVNLVACTMSMDLMGIKKEELIDGVNFGGVAMYLEKAEAGSVNLFI